MFTSTPSTYSSLMLTNSASCPTPNCVITPNKTANLGFNAHIEQHLYQVEVLVLHGDDEGGPAQRVHAVYVEYLGKQKRISLIYFSIADLRPLCEGLSSGAGGGRVPPLHTEQERLLVRGEHAVLVQHPLQQQLNQRHTTLCSCYSF